MGFEFKQVDFCYGLDQPTLKNLSLKFQVGETIAIIGPSGSGKTSLLHLLGTSLRPSRGIVSLFGKDPWQLSALHLQKMRSSIGLIHQSPPIPLRQRVITAILAGRLGQWPFWKSLASLIYPIDIQGPAELLEKLGLTGRLFDRCAQLSGGQLQRVSVARTLYQGAQLILADEPVSAMDPVLADLTIQILKEDALQRQATFIASLHAVDIALRWFPRIIGLRDGAVFFDLRAEDVTQNLLRELYASEAGSIPTQNNQQILGL